MSCQCQSLSQEYQNYINNLRNSGPNCSQRICAPRNPCQVPLWSGITNLREDPCAQKVQERESQMQGCYQTNNFYVWSMTPEEYARRNIEPAHYQKVYRDACGVDVDSDLRYAPLTNPNLIQELFTNPYLSVPYMGAGQASLANKDLEAELQQGLADTHFKACEPASAATIDRFTPLPSFGNPQRVEHVIPTWEWGGVPTRDLVRRVNYDKYCLNLQNAKLINFQWRNGLPLAN